MKKIFSAFVLIVFLSACDAFGVSPQPIPAWTIIPSHTPKVITATPIILTPTFIASLIPDGVTTSTPIIPTDTPSIPTETTMPTFTSTAVQSVAVNILGCDTSIDIMHGMGEVTNSYVMIKNTGMADLQNTCALLRAIDEDLEHPDKQVCVPNLPAQYQVTLKLTVDSAFRENTFIQVDVTSNEVILLRVDKPSCENIALAEDSPADLSIVKPIE